MTGYNENLDCQDLRGDGSPIVPARCMKGPSFFPSRNGHCSGGHGGKRSCASQPSLSRNADPAQHAAVPSSRADDFPLRGFSCFPAPASAGISHHFQFQCHSWWAERQGGAVLSLLRRSVRLPDGVFSGILLQKIPAFPLEGPDGFPVRRLFPVTKLFILRDEGADFRRSI